MMRVDLQEEVIIFISFIFKFNPLTSFKSLKLYFTK
jgi:hypothetical protein